MNIKEILQNSKSNPEASMWKTLLITLDKELQEKIDSKGKDISDKLEAFLGKLGSDISKWSKGIQEKYDNKVEEYIKSKKTEIKGDKGDRGESIVGSQGAKGESVRGEKGDRGDISEIDYERVQRGLLAKVGDLKEKGNEIVAKVNNSQDKLLISSVKNLREELDNIRRTVKDMPKAVRSSGSGGGMGNTQHESTAISSVTTTVTTSNKIAAKGYAIMGAYYQGQMIARGVGYTVGSDQKTLTLLFTPVDGTFIDLIYIRG